MARKKSSRKFQITINNPIDKGYTHEQIKTILDEFSLVYACFCDEIGLESGTPHTHIFLIAKNGVMFDTVQKRFYGAHIEPIPLRKSGHYRKTEKKAQHCPRKYMR